MRIAILSESRADEAAVRILVEGVLGRETQPVELCPIQTRGWPSVLRIIPTVLRHLHYQTDAEALVIVADANHSPLHHATHEEPGRAETSCRLCRLREQVHQVQNSLRPVASRQPQRVQTAIGIAVPAIEAWYRCGLDPQISEATWIQQFQAEAYAHVKNRLKRDVYGTDRPSLTLETEYASREAQRIRQQVHLLEASFPNGFGSLAREVRSWGAT